MSGGSSPQRVRVVYRAVPGALADGQVTDVRCTADGALVVSVGGGGGSLIVVPEVPLSFDTGGVPALAGVIKAAAGSLLDVNGFNNSDATRYFQLFNQVAPAAPASVPVTIMIQVPSQQHFSVSFADGMGRAFDTGIVWASSQTLLTLTPTLVADLVVNAQYR